MPAAPVGSVGSKQARPTDNALHTRYDFYIKASATAGGSKGYFGQYVLHVGCTTESVDFSDNGSLNAAPDVTVGSATTSNYLFAQPTSTRAWCVNLNNYVVDDSPSATSWTGTFNSASVTKLTP